LLAEALRPEIEQARRDVASALEAFSTLLG